MSLDRIFEQPTLPRIDKKVKRPEEIVEYLNRLVGILQENLLRMIVDTQNRLLSLTNVGVWHSKLPDTTTGVYPDGTWRVKEVDDDNFTIEHKVSGAWLPRFTFR